MAKPTPIPVEEARAVLFRAAEYIEREDYQGLRSAVIAAGYSLKWDSMDIRRLYAFLVALYNIGTVVTDGIEHRLNRTKPYSEPDLRALCFKRLRVMMLLMAAEVIEDFNPI